MNPATEAMLQAITLGCETIDSVVGEIGANTELSSTPLLRAQVATALIAIAQIARCVGEAVVTLDVGAELGAGTCIPFPLFDVSHDEERQAIGDTYNGGRSTRDTTPDVVRPGGER